MRYIVTMKANEIYFETLGEAVRAFVSQTFAKGGTLAENEHANIAEKIGPVSYGQTVSRSFELSDLKGKSTKSGRIFRSIGWKAGGMN